jgi:hypothetical protein
MRGPKIPVVLVLLAMCTILISCELPNPWVTIFSDNFDRGNDQSVGGEWSEIYMGPSPEPSSSISDNRLLLTGGIVAASDYPAVVVKSIPLVGDFRVSFGLKFSSELTRIHLYVVTADMTADTGWYAIGAFPGQLGVWKGAAALTGSVAPTLDPAHSFTMEIRREEAKFFLVLTDTITNTQWAVTSADDEYHDITAIHLKGGYREGGNANSVLVDDFVLQTR